MTEPTQKEIKEFWEWCGFKFYKNGSVTLYIYPDGKREPWYVDSPDLDLNNLFKYAFKVAVRKLTDEHNYSEIYAIETIMKSWMLESGYEIPDANTLLRAIQEVIHNGR